MAGLPQIFDFGYFVWFSGKLIENKKSGAEAELQGPVYLDRIANYLINIVGCKIEVNGASAIHVIVWGHCAQFGDAKSE